MGKFLSIPLKLNFTLSTLGCYGLKIKKSLVMNATRPMIFTVQ